MPFLPLVFLFLVACSDNLLHSETKPLYIERISIKVQDKPDTVLTDYSHPYIDTILKGAPVSFYAKINSSGTFYNCFWFFDADEKGEPCRQNRRDTVFDSTGLYRVKLYVRDIFSDTLSANMFFRVSSKPICSDISLDVFQGSPIFKWHCQNTDAYSDELTYRFILKTKDKADTLFLKEEFLQLGYPLPSDYWEVQLNAENSYGLKDSTELSIW